MKYFLIPLILFVFVAPAYGQDQWDRIDKSLFATFLSLQVTDALQTKYIFDHPEEHAEDSPRINKAVEEFGTSFIPIYFATYILATYLISDRVPSWLRKTILIGASSVSFMNVNHNYAVGVGFAF